jgi:hypothetical protein
MSMPAACPSCSRFLARDLVASLADGPVPCPRCGTELTAATVVERPATRSVRPPDLDEDVVRAEDVDASVRPTDLDPVQVGPVADDSDPLAGWDDGDADVIDLAGYRSNHHVLALDPARAAAAGAVGAVAGALLSRRHRAAGALAGAAVSVTAAAAGQAYRETRRS